MNSHKIPLICAAAAASMFGFAFAAVPLYDLFCRVTGYGGTTSVSQSAPTDTLNRTFTIRLDSNVDPSLDWEFKPLTNTLQIKVGQTVKAAYLAQNKSGKTIAASATFNVTPNAAGSYVSKIECFCFTRQILSPGENARMETTFYIDPEIVQSREMDNINTLTLSYTFYPVPHEEEPQS